MSNDVPAATTARPTTRKLPTGLTAISQPLPGIAIATPSAAGAVVDSGAHVLAWAPNGTEGVLWLSPASKFEVGVAIRGGIPLCFPWFAAGPQGDQTPAHGVARSSQWRLIESGVPDGVAHLLYELTSADIAESAAPNCLPGGAVAHLSVGMNEKLRLDFSVTAGTEPLTYEVALHTYFAVSDVRQIRVEGLDGRPFFNKVTQEHQTQDGPVTFPGEVDSLYDHEGAASIVDSGLNRTIRIAKRNSSSTIVWNPGPVKGTQIGDVPASDWPNFVCVETANVGEHAITLAPRQSHTLTVVYDVVNGV